MPPLRLTAFETGTVNHGVQLVPDLQVGGSSGRRRNGQCPCHGVEGVIPCGQPEGVEIELQSKFRMGA